MKKNLREIDINTSDNFEFSINQIPESMIQLDDTSSLKNKQKMIKKISQKQLIPSPTNPKNFDSNPNNYSYNNQNRNLNNRLNNTFPNVHHHRVNSTSFNNKTSLQENKNDEKLNELAKTIKENEKKIEKRII